MIFGAIHISARAVQTHRDSYLLSHLTVISVRRPFLAGSLMFAAGGGAFGLAFADLLYPREITALAVVLVAGLIAGFWIGQIQLLSRDLRGSELSAMIYGSYGHLNHVRRQIIAAVNSVEEQQNGQRT